MAAHAHRLGFAVKLLGDGGLPSHDARRWQSGPHLRHSLAMLRAILDRLDALDVRMYRMATALAPYASHPDLPRFHDQVVECAEELAQVGALARERGIRLSTHPGQYTVLNSERPDTQAAAIAELEVQAALLDALGLHADLVDPIGFERFLRETAPAARRDFDVMLEAKAKDLALLRLREQLALRDLPWRDRRVVVGRETG